MARDRDGPELIARLRRAPAVLGLTHIAEHLEEYLAWATRERFAPSALLERVVGVQAQLKRERRIERRIEQSGLRAMKTLEAFQWDFQPGLDRGAMLELGTLA